MIEFTDNKPIYRQIIDRAYNLILDGSWEPGERVPSVREMSAELGVNTRTVMKAMEELQDAGIIVSRRGMGYSLAEDAVERVRSARRDEFFRVTLPAFRSEMEILGISVEEAFGGLNLEISK